MFFKNGFILVGVIKGDGSNKKGMGRICPEGTRNGVVVRRLKPERTRMLWNFPDRLVTCLLFYSYQMSDCTYFSQPFATSAGIPFF